MNSFGFEQKLLSRGVRRTAYTPNSCAIILFVTLAKSLDKYPEGVYNKAIVFTEVTRMEEQSTCPCCGKIKERSEDEQRKLIHRLNRMEGQIRGIRGMVEKDAYCTDILVQVAAVNAALNAFNRELLANHIRTCVAEDIRSGRDEVIDELVATLQKLMK